MKLLKITLIVTGGLALLMALVWVGQGTGYFPYPRSSFMIEKSVWVYRGACLAGVGILTIVIGQRL